MTWEEHAQRSERVPCTVVEVDLDWVAHEDLEATNVDGSLCYRTPSTINQPDVEELEDYEVVTKTRRWMTRSQKPLASLGAIPCVRSVKIQSEEARVGKGLGHFGQVTIELEDLVDDDRREDPFYEDTSRDDVDHSAGTYFAKLIARNPYMTNRRLRVIEGWTTDGVFDESDAITHYFFIRDIQGPIRGRVKITAVGPLQLINVDDREIPAPSAGRLKANINAVTTAAVIDPPEFAEDYPASGFIRIEDEVVAFTRAGVNLTMTRAQLGTTAATHRLGDTLQLCAHYEDENLVDILTDVLTTYGGVDASLINTADWDDEQDTWLPDYILSGTITKPTKVLAVVKELLESAAAMCWWDDEGGLLQLAAIRPALAIDATWSDRFHLLEAVEQKRDMSERVSRCDVLLDLRSADKDPQQQSSYRTRLVGDTEGELPTEHGTPAVRFFVSRWLNAGQIQLAVRASAQMTLCLSNGRVTFTCEVSAKDAARKIGDVVDLLTREIVDRTGQPERMRCIVVRREPIMAGARYRYVLEAAPFGGRYAFYTAADCPDYDDASAAERDPGGFYSNAAGDDFGPDDPAYLYG